MALDFAMPAQAKQIRALYHSHDREGAVDLLLANARGFDGKLTAMGRDDWALSVLHETEYLT